MTRIALLTNCVSRAGAETQMVRLAVELRRRGHEVGVLSIVTPLAFVGTLEEAGIPVVTLAPDDPSNQQISKTHVLRGVVPAVRVLRRWNTEALLCFVHEASLFGRLVGRLARVPVIIGSERNMWREGGVDRVISRMTDGLLSITVANAPQVAADLVYRGVVPSSRVVVVPNAINVADYQHTPTQRETVRDALRTGSDFAWLAVGRLEPQKDYPLLLSAFATVAHRISETQLFIVGEGSLRSELEAHARDVGIDDRVHFLGERDDVPELLAGADGFVMSSLAEGLPNAMMEALAAGLPVVATEVGGVPELIAPGQSGLLSPPEDATLLADAMLKLMNTPPLERRVLGDHGRQRLSERYGTPRVTTAWVELIDACRVRRSASHRRTKSFARISAQPFGDQTR